MQSETFALNVRWKFFSAQPVQNLIMIVYVSVQTQMQNGQKKSFNKKFNCNILDINYDKYIINMQLFFYRGRQHIGSISCQLHCRMLLMWHRQAVIHMHLNVSQLLETFLAWCKDDHGIFPGREGFSGWAFPMPDGWLAAPAYLRSTCTAALQAQLSRAVTVQLKQTTSVSENTP